MIEELGPDELQRRRQAGELWQILDVREPWEIEIASVTGTLNIPMAEVAGRMGELDPAHPTAVLCHSGKRSRCVAEFLLQNGYRRVVNIAGGIDAWSLTVDASVPRYR